ncbi:amino acid permease [Clostridium magnum]|uniref:GABA permease n=1 Tax=Clostridium magnum DSM 2767 TaxID=1121326 RepID=A0A161WQZ7_9CLOT|nr:amino acid permease [Clostridium magnum]KZL89128.1 GABA permease [Clostridium magnum DSM 2767]SHI03390.1 GABA permease [Clostridium magnum DSM 2767]
MSNDSLKRDLKARHLMMISIGGVIGAGYFLGAGAAIKTAGPAVVISYALGGLVTILVMALLAEMAVAMPLAGSFQTYASKAISPWAGFVTGWTYWLAFLIGPASETIAAGTFLHLWFPTVPVWVFCLVVAILMTIVNLIGVLVFGEVEFWLSLIKVVALLVFIIWGATALLGIPMQTDISLANLTSNGGFAPAGLAGIFGAMIIVIFAYGGTEAIGTAAEESSHPERDIPKALTGTVIRIIVLYIISITVLVTVLPWNKAGVSSSPYVDAFNILGGPVAGNIMNFVVLTAALSCIDTGVYATSRMLFSLSRDGFFPKTFAKLHPERKTPVNAIFVSSLVLFIGAIMFFLFPDFAYVWLASLSGFGFLFTWLMIALSQPGMRKIIEKKDPSLLKWKVPFYPYTQYLVVILMIAILAAQLFVPNGWIILAAGLGWLVFASIYYFVFAKNSSKKDN